MSATWHGERPPPVRYPYGLAGWLRITVKGLLLAVLVFGGLALLLVIRLLERPLFGIRRPMTPLITVFVCRMALRIIGLELSMTGAFDARAGAVVANHSSWLDIFVLNAVKRVYFVSKAEVANWPGIGWLARATGTVFIERNRARAAQQAQLFQARLGAGHRLLFFPEGTSSDGRRVLPFKTTLFEAFFAEGLRETMQIQPATLIYHSPADRDVRFYGWWGDMEFGAHFLDILAAPKQGQVEVIYHAPLRVAAFDNRKPLAAAAEAAIRTGYQTAERP